MPDVASLCLEMQFKSIDVRHKQAAAMMAHAYSRLTGKSAVINSAPTRGPAHRQSALAPTARVNASLSPPSPSGRRGSPQGEGSQPSVALTAVLDRERRRRSPNRAACPPGRPPGW